MFTENQYSQMGYSNQRSPYQGQSIGAGANAGANTPIGYVPKHYNGTVLQKPMGTNSGWFGYRTPVGYNTHNAQSAIGDLRPAGFPTMNPQFIG